MSWMEMADGGGEKTSTRLSIESFLNIYKVWVRSAFGLISLR